MVTWQRRFERIVREMCRANDDRDREGAYRPDHVHLLLSVPPKLSPSRVMQAIKGKTSHHLTAGLPAAEEGVLGSAPVGTRVLRGVERQRDRRVVKEYIE